MVIHALRRSALVLIVAPALLAPCAVAKDSHPDHHRPGFYRQTNLVSDMAGVALNTDPNLVNPWGIAINPRGPIWVSNNGTGTSTVYDNDGNPLPSETSPLVVAIPAPAGSPSGSAGAPTGTVFNDSSDFPVSANGKTGPARFLFATEDGTVAGWSPAVNQKNAIPAFDNSAAGANYKGIAIGRTATGNHLYLANFGSGAVDVLDAGFHQVTLSGSFTDPNLPAGFAPFGIQNIGGVLFVSYAMQDADKHDDVPGPGHGYIDMYTTGGQLIGRFASEGALDSPWGMAVAPRDFGPLGGSLLVGNFGDGRINAYDIATGASRGPLMDSRGRPITIEGLWGLSFAVPTDAHERNNSPLIFTAGIGGEGHGLFGRIDPAMH